MNFFEVPKKLVPLFHLTLHGVVIEAQMYYFC